MEVSKFEILEGKTIHVNKHINKILNDQILKIVSDKYCRMILTVSLIEPKSATDLSNETEIPISTIYRRLQDLMDAKLLKITGSINNDGKKHFLYQSKIKEINTIMNGSEIDTFLVLANKHDSNL